jgi:HAD domain in Swiss Army Knife RNA repair proteins
MRVLFLEFDGVLHPASATSRFFPANPLKRSVQQAWLFRWAWILDELLSPHDDVGIIVHSNWRLIAPDDELQSFLGPLSRRFIGSTPRAERWESIARVVESNRLRNFRILDAIPAAFPPEVLQLIACNPEAGLKDYTVHAQLKTWLEQPS